MWGTGKPTHNKERNECCPDFSCCTPELLAPEEVRNVFINAYLKDDHKIMDRMLMEFLGKMITLKFGDGKAHIAGLEEARREIVDNGY